MDGWKWNLYVSIIFLSKTRVISRRNQNWPPLPPLLDTHTTHPLVTLLPHLCLLFWGRSFLQPEAAYCVDQPSFPFKKARWPQMSGRHMPPSSVRSKWELKGARRCPRPRGSPHFSSWWAGQRPPQGALSWDLPCVLSPSVMLLYVLRGYASN